MLRRLEAAAALLPSLIGVLDPREVFRRLSTAGAAALPHDLLILGLFDESLTTMTLHTISAQSAVIDQVPAERYPVAASHAFDFDILDDRAAHPIERDRMPTGLGMRSSLRLPLRVDDRVIGGVGFNLATPRAYSIADVAVGRRLADIVAVALSHQRSPSGWPTRRGAHEELRAQRGEPRATRHDRSIALTDRGARVRGLRRASRPSPSRCCRTMPPRCSCGSPTARAPAATPAWGSRRRRPRWSTFPAELLRPTPSGSTTSSMTCAERRGPPYEGLVRQGFLSLLRVSLRHDERFAGALVFVARQAGGVRGLDGRPGPAHRRSHGRDLGARSRARGSEAGQRGHRARRSSSKRACGRSPRSSTRAPAIAASSASRRRGARCSTQATQVAATDTTVLLLGESGTGKEVVARFVHRASPRSQRAVRRVELRRAARAAARGRALRLRARRLHRRDAEQARSARAGGRRHAAARRGRRDEPVGAGQVPARAAGARVQAAGRHARRCAPTLESWPRPTAICARRWPRASSARTSTTASTCSPFACRPLRERRDDILPLCDAFLTEIGRGLGRPPAGVSREARTGAPRLRLAGQRPRAAQHHRARGDSLRRRAHHHRAPVLDRRAGAARPCRQRCASARRPVEMAVPATAPPPAPGDIQSRSSAR